LFWCSDIHLWNSWDRQFRPCLLENVLCEKIKSLLFMVPNISSMWNDEMRNTWSSLCLYYVREPRTIKNDIYRTQSRIIYTVSCMLVSSCRHPFCDWISLNVFPWRCTLEDTVGKAVTRGLVDNKEVNKMIHAMLCTGLQTSLKDISGHTFDDIQDCLRLSCHLGLNVRYSVSFYTSWYSVYDPYFPIFIP
jgi:hypothetical protein